MNDVREREWRMYPSTMRTKVNANSGIAHASFVRHGCVRVPDERECIASRKHSRPLRECAPAVGVRPGKRDRVSANTERLEQFSSIGRSPIVKPFMPAGYARYLFFSVGRPRALSPSPLPLSLPPTAFLSRVSLQRNRIRLLLFPPESPPRFLRQGTFDTRPCFSLAALLRCNCTFFHPLLITVRFARTSPFSSSPYTTFSHVIFPSVLSSPFISFLPPGGTLLFDTAPSSTRIFEATPAMILPDQFSLSTW